MRFPKLPSGKTAAQEREEKRRRHKADRRRFRLWCIARDKERCRRCGKRVNVDWTDSDPNAAEVNEIRSRSVGGSDLDSTNCCTLCKTCHYRYTTHRFGIVALSAAGANGDLEFPDAPNILPTDRRALDDD